MKEFTINKKSTEADIMGIFDEIQAIIELGADVKVSVSKKSNGTLSLDRHWRALMQEVAKIMRERGCKMVFQSTKGKGSFERAFSAEDAHELFSRYLLPIDETGKRKSWSKSGRKGMQPATTGERCQALEKLYAYWVDKGYSLSRFKNSEYESLQEKQNY